MKIKSQLCGLSLGVAVVLLSACGSQPKLTSQQIMSQYSQVASLDKELKKARSEGSELLSPASYTTAKEYLDEAVSAAESNDIRDANAAAAQGLKVMKRVQQDTERSRDILGEVLNVRSRALAASASSAQKQKVAALDEVLKESSGLIEKGNTEKAKQNRPKLISSYAQLELSALKQGTANLAKASIAEAKKQGAADLAPKTLAQAEEEMKLAVTILDANRTDRAKAEKHAQQAKWYAEKSAAISETVRDFDRRDYSMEDIVLWHQNQLAMVNEPVGIEMPFNQPGEKAAISLRNAVKGLMNEKAQLTATGKKYGEQLATTQKERQESLRKKREAQQKFDRVQSMFGKNEANVYRQGQNVLISAHGFSFPSGQSEIQAGNFQLMNKITSAIKTFPGARIEVKGHTDSLGSAKVNQQLSEARAQKVAKFLVDLGGIDRSKVSSRGFGELRPVASNETRTGRAENRRVEIMIVN